MNFLLSDSQIVERLRSGDTEVLKYCYPKAFPKVQAMVIQNSGTDDDAKDLFQEGIIIFYKNCLSSSFELTASISTYLYAICWRLWMKELRNIKTSRLELSDNVDMVEAFDFELAYKSEDIFDEVVTALEKLGKNCKAILIYFYFNKLSYAEIASKLDYKDERAVREQKYRCMNKIKEEMRGVNYAK